MFKKIPALMLLCAIPWIIGMTKPVRAEYIGINELQTEANIEWKKEYVDRYGRTVSVDVTPIIPQVDKVPIQIMENQILPVENVLNIYPQSMVQEEIDKVDEEVIILHYQNQERNERGAVYICQEGGKLVLFEYDDLNTKINKETTKLESFSGTQYLICTPNTGHPVLGVFLCDTVMNTRRCASNYIDKENGSRHQKE